MARRNTYLAIALGAFFMFSLYLYNGIDTGSDMRIKRQEYVQNLQSKLGKLEEIAKANEKTIEQLEKELKEAKVEVENSRRNAIEEEVNDEEKNVGAEPKIDEEIDERRGNKVAHVHEVLQRNQKTTPSMSNVCGIRENVSSPNTELQMLDLYENWAFDNPDGGVWKQGFPITYDAEKVKSDEKLEVIIIPHSHCDPGWIFTFEEYYQRQTRNILNGMAKHLEAKESMKFIYAEVSFFELWWREQNEETRNRVRKFIEDGKLEIVTGGWVMTDEANAHYHSMLVELFEGHEWIQNHLGKAAKPKSHWSIDPFGLSPSLPHLLTSANITNAVLQRVHYTVKRELALKKNLEFYWRQLFGAAGHPDLRAHIMPFYSYDIPHTCGPEPAICCQFDFRRMPEGGKSCDWGIPPQKINENNVAQRAHMIYDQYRKKAQLFRNNVIFAPLGDDFRYDIDFEWDSQYENYQKLFDYMNNQNEWNVHARFGTVRDYFEALDAKLKSSETKLPTLTGDFFTYADRDDHYWSGYFTSRPFYKQLDRVLQHYLRSAELAFTLASIEEEGMVEAPIFQKLVQARRALSLFQHHDGVTGTAKDHVVLDYGKKMIEALRMCEDVLSEGLTILLGLDTTKPMQLDEYRENESVLPKRRVYSIGQNVVVFNPLARSRPEPVCIYVSSAEASIEAEPPIENQQISPVFNYAQNSLKIDDNVYELCFAVNLGPMTSASYRIVSDATRVHKVEILSNLSELKAPGFDLKELEPSISIGNTKVTAIFDTSGMLKTITHSADKTPIEMNAHFVHYGARKSQRKFANGNEDNPSGAYLFLPDGDAKRIDNDENSPIVIRGKCVSRVVSAPLSELQVLQTYSLLGEHDFLDMDTEVDVRSKENFELALRFETSVSSGDDFFTDLNGLQMIRRKRQSKLPIQANFYPMAAGVFVEDDKTRFTIHSAQALGVASLKSGAVEIMLDRRLSSDDNRGLQQGVRDNKRTVSRMRLLAEPMNAGGHGDKERIGFHSAVSHYATWSLHYPVVKMMAEATPKPISMKNFEAELNCDIHVVTMRTMAAPTAYESADMSMAAERKAALVVHRVVPDCRSKLKLPDEKCAFENEQISPISLIGTIKEARNSTLTALYEGEKMTKFEILPNDVKSIIISW
ncbi:unnamed protein product [Caenorhabditis bovis]|uniref:Alpha-mannosidase n=1 Tax=Caenorhabditis bovis TaxID=2654633 RepID=A0A8S1EFL4_9PELO|nr:unnamed protein product [Caenorhabditis bovis]